MESYVITHADLLYLVESFAWMLFIALCSPLVYRFGCRLIDLLFDGFAFRLRLVRRKNPRFVLDSYRCWVTYRHTWSARKHYGRFEP